MNFALLSSPAAESKVKSLKSEWTCEQDEKLKLVATHGTSSIKAVGVLHSSVAAVRVPCMSVRYIYPSFIITHRAKLGDGPSLYETFRDKKDGCIKFVMTV